MSQTTREVVIKRTLTFNLSKYEQMTTEVIVTGIDFDTDGEDISVELDRLQAGEVHRAALATVHHPDDNATSVYEWDRITKEGADA